MSPKAKRLLLTGLVVAGTIAAGAYGLGPVVAPVAERILTRTNPPAVTPAPAVVTAAPADIVLSPEAQRLVAAPVGQGDLAGFERRLERERFRPLREYVMELERRIAELEGRGR